MLASRTWSSRAVRKTCTVSRRGFFDYVKYANGVDNGQSLQSQLEEETKNATREGPFSWEFIKWYEKNAPQQAGYYNTMRSQYQRYEQFSNDRSLDRAAQSVDFDKFRREIADAKFVDELEVDYYVTRNTLGSIKSMSTLDSWDRDKLSEFETELGEGGDLLMKPLSEAEKIEQNERYALIDAQKEKMAALKAEFLQFYEESDVERMMCGQTTPAMKMAQNPIYAEQTEDLQCSQQFYGEYVMNTGMNEWIKRERAMGIRDENQRKIFLERFDQASIIQHGSEGLDPGLAS